MLILFILLSDILGKKKIVDVPESSLVRYYNKSMSGVDRIPFFMFMLDAAVQNTSLL